MIPKSSDRNQIKETLSPVDNYGFAILLSILLLLLLINPQSAHSQFIYFTMEVESELRADVVRELNFGTVGQNTGRVQVPLGSNNMGIFSIRAIKNQRILVNLQTPEFLEPGESGSESRIPIILNAAYANRGANNVQQAVPFTGNTVFHIGGVEDSAGESGFSWEQAYVYIYGEIEVGDVPPDTYTGEAVLSVEYF